MKTADQWFAERRMDISEGRQSPTPSKEFYKQIQDDAFCAGLSHRNENIEASIRVVAAECNCRAEHGAEGALHLLAIEKMLRKIIE